MSFIANTDGPFNGSGTTDLFRYFLSTPGDEFSSYHEWDTDGFGVKIFRLTPEFRENFDVDCDDEFAIVDLNVLTGDQYPGPLSFSMKFVKRAEVDRELELYGFKLGFNEEGEEDVVGF